jgi:DNA-binding MarR family transcriptional regulator
MPSQTTAPDLLADALRPLLLRLSRRLRQEAQKAGVSALDALILGQIHRNPGVGVCQLADAERLSRPTMSSHVKRLEAAGWVARADHADDGRRSGLAVTPTGEARLEEIRRLRNDWLSSRLTQLAPDERDQIAQAAPALLKLLSLDA